MRSLRPFLLAIPLLLMGMAAFAQQPQTTLQGIVLRNMMPFPAKEVVIQRITDDRGAIDTTANSGLFRHAVYTDSTGYYSDAIPFASDSNVHTYYYVKVRDCDGSIRLVTFEVQPSGVSLQSINLCVNTPPTCNITADFTLQSNDLFVFTTASNPVAGQSNVWTYGDGTADSGATCGHTYATPGTYTICHIVDLGPGCHRQVCRQYLVGDSTQIPRYAAGMVFTNNSCTPDSMLVEFFGLNQNNYNSQVMFWPDSCHFFAHLPPDHYLLRITPIAQSLLTANYMPTYFGDVVGWNSSSIIDLTGSSRYDLNVNLQRADTVLQRTPTGGGVNVTMTGDGTLFNVAGAPAPHMFTVPTARVILSTGTGKKVAWSYGTSNDPTAHFAGLPAGAYSVIPDMPFMTSDVSRVALPAGSSTTVTYQATAAGLVNSVTAIRIAGKATLQAYPNPARTSLSLFLPKCSGAASVSLIAADGRTAFSQEVNDLANPVSVSVQSLTPGLYHAVITQQGRQLSAARIQVAHE